MNNQNLEEFIIKTVKVDRSLSPKKVIRATGRIQYVNNKVLSKMPHGEREEVQVYFFKVGRRISCADLEKEYALRELKPDPMAQAKVNQDDPAFADTYSNGCQWKNAKDQYCYARFAYERLDGWSVKFRVDVHQSNCSWDDDWWFGGVRK